jgi:hypothetical protein
MALTIPLDAWVALLTTAGEVGGHGYTREPITFEYTEDGITAANAANVQWAQATGSWGTITGIAVYDAATAGNLLSSGLVPVSAPAVYLYERVYIPAGGMQVSLGTVGTGYGVGGFGTGPYGTARELVSSQGVLLLKTFAPVALCGGTSGQWTPHGPFEVA